MSVTTRFANSSQRLVKRFGRDVTYGRLVQGTRDPDTGGISDNSETTETVKAFKSSKQTQEDQSPNLVGEEDVMYIIAGSDISFVPKPDDTITSSYLGNDFKVTVKSVKEHWAGDTVSLWRLFCRAN